MTGFHDVGVGLFRFGRLRLYSASLLIPVAHKFSGETGVRSSHSDNVERASSWRRPYVIALMAGDAVAVAAGTLAAQSLRFDGLRASEAAAGTGVSYLVVALLAAPLWVATLGMCGVYEGRRLGNGSEEYRRIFNAAVRFLAVVAVAALALKLDPARAMVALALPLASVLTVSNHYLARRWLHARRRAGACVHRVVVVGTESQVADLVRHFRRAGHAGLHVVGACVPGLLEKVDVDGEPVAVVGNPDEVADALRDLRADTVAVADTVALSNGALRRLGWELEGSGVDLLVAPSVIDVAGPRIAIHPVAGLPLLHVEEPARSGPAIVAKHGGERLVAAVLLAVVSPVLVVVALAVRSTSRGPALFKQVRVGRGGRLFTLYKFRTMRVSAEAELVDLTEQSDNDGPLFKMRADPRRTALGRRLRRFSVDELPQLWNVVKGEMSIVGPRPPLPREVAGYTDEVRRRLLVKPGLTGLWQVSGRANLPWHEAVRLDLYYVENWSPALDLAILCKTVTAVVRGRGAY